MLLGFIEPDLLINKQLAGGYASAEPRLEVGKIGLIPIGIDVSISHIQPIF
jgi:hypothetical protein